jgi:hypothetical protein
VCAIKPIIEVIARIQKIKLITTIISDWLINRKAFNMENNFHELDDQQEKRGNLEVEFIS